MRNGEVFERRRRMLHGFPVRLTAHDNADEGGVRWCHESAILAEFVYNERLSLLQSKA